MSIRHHFIREHVSNRKIKIKVAYMEDRIVEIIKRDMSGELFHNHNNSLYNRCKEEEIEESDG
jgi:hypothetical protein